MGRARRLKTELKVSRWKGFMGSESRERLARGLLVASAVALLAIPSVAAHGGRPSLNSRLLVYG